MRHWIYCKTAAFSLSVLLCQSCSNAVSSPDHEYSIFKFCCPWSEMYIASCIPSPTICLFPYLGYLLLTPDNSNSLRFSYSECSSYRVIRYQTKSFWEKLECVIVSKCLIFMFVEQLIFVDVVFSAVLSNSCQKTTMADFRYKSIKSWKVDNIDLT